MNRAQTIIAGAASAVAAIQSSGIAMRVALEAACRAGANLGGANLGGANLRGAYLREAA